MSKSPGHQRAPNHKVIESAVPARMTVELHGETFADSRNVLQAPYDEHVDLKDRLVFDESKSNAVLIRSLP